MPTFPAKTNYASGDILTAAQMVDVGNGLNDLLPDAKGSLTTVSAANTPAQLTVGANGETLVADSSATTGLRWQGNFAAGKNKIINGDFGIWQRGTSFTSQTFGTYYADRWVGGADGGGTRTISQQTFTPGTAPMAGYEGTFFLRNARSVAGSGSTYDVVDQRVEDVRTFAGQTMTFSFWAKADATRSLSIGIEQIYGSGGSATTTATGSTFSLTTSWARYSFTTSIPSISGKTIGSNSYLNLRFVFPLNTTFTIDIWGVQAEAGDTATAFQTATGTLAGELALAQRYYYRSSADSVYATYGHGTGDATNAGYFVFKMPVTMRIEPASLDFNNIAIFDGTNIIAATGLTITSANSSKDAVWISYSATGAVDEKFYTALANNNTNSYVGVSAEL